MSNVGGQGAVLPEAEMLLQRVSGIIAGARALPLSSSVKLDNKDEVLELLREAVERLPKELREARWMIKEREEYLASTQRKADELVEAARSEAQRLVQRTEIVKEARAEARRLVEEAREEAGKLRLEAEDYADQKLAQFEIVLERTLKTVAAGRQKLAGLPERPEGSTAGPVGPGGAGNEAGGISWDPVRGGEAGRSAEAAFAVGGGDGGHGESTYPGVRPRGDVSAGGAGRGGGTPEVGEAPEGGKRGLFDQDSV